MSTAYFAPASKVAGALRLFLLLSIGGFVAMSLGGVQRFLERRRIVTEWPSTAATVQGCALHEDFPFRADGRGVLLWVRCTLRYAANGRDVSASVVSSTLGTGKTHAKTVAIRDRGFVIVKPYAELKAWLRAHPIGTPLTVHVDPEHPDRPTLVGLGEPVDIDPVPGSIAGVAMFVAIGLAARWGAKRLDARAGTANGG
ncbi:MAG: DUF3592 domain-containing protein [Gemmatimonadales bacterium]